MNLREMLEVAHNHMIDSCCYAVVFWCTVVLFILAGLSWWPTAQTITMVFIIGSGLSYLERKAKFQKVRMEIAETMGFDHILER